MLSTILNVTLFLRFLQEAEKEAELAKQKKAEKAEKKKQAKNKNKPSQAKPTTQNTQAPQTEVRPYTRSRPIGQTSKQDTSADQSETRTPAVDPSRMSDGPSPAVYVRGQKRKVSKRFDFHVVFAVVWNWWKCPVTYDTMTLHTETF